MQAAGKASDEINLKPLGINSWLSVYAVAEASKWVKGAVNATTLTRAMRAQKKPVNLFGLTTWNPGAKGPAAFPRWSSSQGVLPHGEGRQDRLVGQPAAPRCEPMKSMKYVR